ncbi:hypothetical protein, partial [Bradyrhizobium sp.]|uniref:hypothetical protein n=1 Tax=Bradyrhizobium sp. TaxID=376 RepID=UPI003C73D191
CAVRALESASAGRSTRALGNFQMRGWYIVALLVGLIMRWDGVEAATPDQCARLIPSDVAALLVKAYSGYRLPRASDNLEEDIVTSRNNGGSGCLGVAVADFSGSGKPGVAVLMTALKGSGFVVAVALFRTGSWHVAEIYREREGRSSQYIESVAPGRYDHVETYEPNKSKGELEYLNCLHSGFMTGTFEASGDVFCIAKGRWQHVPVID